ncbi:hypothetical protein GALMADRAFT_1169565 [Galerina marginata CBS 339.88]|uniref:Uncharacterized protein n=1 Tax=Galerina marginata (strain CBS 339.88) TaxID=685588 RepID=A0A067TLU5_GALM3|nr:hypothetical protein GALMADRAFT_1169565 [Galerina marginata CBS 339.88]
MRAGPSPKIFAKLRILSSQSFIGDSRPHSGSFRSIIGWLETLPEPPLDLYLHFQLVLLEVEERERQDDDSTPVMVATFNPGGPSSEHPPESAIVSQRKLIVLFAWIGVLYLRLAAFLHNSIYKQ